MIVGMHIISSTDWYVTHFTCGAGRFLVGRPVDLGGDAVEVLAAAKRSPGISITEVPSTDQEGAE
jgi:hypothetical protein